MSDSFEEVAVKVAVKLRPVLQEDLAKRHQTSHAPCISVCQRTNEVVVMEQHTFHFDYAFPPEATHEDLFNRCIKPVLTNIFKGYNATIFAYGQTGSGKTHTMGIEDPQKVVVNRIGIIPQSVEWIFNQIESRKSKHPNYRVKISFIEIYQEELYDLLDPSEKVLVMRQDGNGEIVICGMKEKICTTVEEVLYFLKIGTTVRHTDSTQMNKKSSRSHSIFTFIIEQLPEEEKRVTKTSRRHLTSKLHFVDLAGSERAKKTGNTGKKFRESVYINSGLLALNSVISILTRPSKVKICHIPYRQSKLTRILKDSLGGNAMALMICCISPFANDLQESISTLKYAAEARNIRNNPHMNWKELQRNAIVNEEGYFGARKKDVQTKGVQTSEFLSNFPKFEDHHIYGILKKLYLLCIDAKDYLVDALPLIKEHSKFSRKFQNWLVQWSSVEKDLQTIVASSLSDSSISESGEEIQDEDASVDIEQAVQVLDNLALAYKNKTCELVKLRKKVRKFKGTVKTKMMDDKGFFKTKVTVKANSTHIKALDLNSDSSSTSTNSIDPPIR